MMHGQKIIKLRNFCSQTVMGARRWRSCTGVWLCIFHKVW